MCAVDFADANLSLSFGNFKFQKYFQRVVSTKTNYSLFSNVANMYLFVETAFFPVQFYFDQVLY